MYYGDKRDIKSMPNQDEVEPRGPELLPCEDCGLTDWPDWTLLPHEVYNAVCPGGSGYLCLPCFAKRVTARQPQPTGGEISELEVELERLLPVEWVGTKQDLLELHTKALAAERTKAQIAELERLGQVLYSGEPITAPPVWATDILKEMFETRLAELRESGE